MTFAVLWRATRAYSLPASVVPILLGTILAARGYGELGGGHFDARSFCAVLLGGVLAHFGANVLNDYFDFVNGVDTRPEHGSGVLTSALMTSAQALRLAGLLFAGAGVCGLFLLGTHSAALVPIALTGLACAVLYPAFLKKYGFGDVLIILAFGFGLTSGAYLVQSGAIGLRQWLLVALYSLPVCLLVDAILHANNLRDAADDRAAHVRTLATLLPPAAGRTLQRVLLFGPLFFVAVSVLFRLLPLWSLGAFLSTPMLTKAARDGSVPGTAQAHLVFGLLYSAAFLLPPIFL